MKAIICKEFGDPNVMQLGEVSTPTINEEEVLVKGKNKKKGLQPSKPFFKTQLSLYTIVI